MRKQLGGIGTGLAVFIVIVMLAVGACFAIADDDEDSMGPMKKDRREQGDDRSRGRDSRGKCENADYCQDNDGINADKVYICLPEANCSFGEGETAALLPPNPEKLIKAIQAGAEGIGAAAGALAGAIAALPPSILL